MKLSANDIVLKLLGLLLLTAAVLKGYELLTEPVANTDIWSNRYFLIFTVEFELALAIWLLSGIFKKLAWLAATACFNLFCCITLYKALAGFGSCGCFGKVHVNPWVTLLAIDLPAVVLLAVYRPKDLNFQSITKPVSLLKPIPNITHLAGVCLIGIAAIAITSSAIAFNEPATTTSTYEVLEPETWIGKELPILKHIDIAEKISKGSWLLLFYHYDCPDCQKAIIEYEQMARDFENNEEFIRLALIGIPPFGVLLNNQTCTYRGRLDTTKDWFITTPSFLFVSNNRVVASWKQTVPDIEMIFNGLTCKESMNKNNL